MAGFTKHTGKIGVVPQDHVDTDRIIPARFLSRVSRFGYGEELFCDVRGPEFPLDQPEAKDASILVVGTNFGCGSSREHAVWAIQQAGFAAVIGRREETSPGFSDIFRGNAGNCGLLLIELDPADHAKVAGLGNGAEITVDLEGETITTPTDAIPFRINPVTRAALLEGLDLIGTTLRYDADIATYEAKHSELITP